MSKLHIAGEMLEFSIYDEKVTQPITGEFIAKLFGIGDPKEYCVIQWLADGSLETLRPKEEAKIEEKTNLRFIVFRSASTYMFEIDGRRMEWGAPRIRGDVIKKLAEVNPAEYGVWQESTKGDDKRIENDKFAELSTAGLEIFFTAKEESTEGVVT